jgi:NADH:ubiquinone oxidoreductase subunit 2 (subunit N)
VTALAASSLAHGAAAALLALLCAGLLLQQDLRGRGRLRALGIWLALAPLGFALLAPARAHLGWVALIGGLVIALLARDAEDPLHSECALKMMWVMVPALALSYAGLELLTLATGTSVVAEQWAVLQLGLDRPFLWSMALTLSLLIGLVLLGGAPLHFWVADLMQGARPWLGPLAVVALQATGARWLAARTEGIETFPAGAALAQGLLEFAALAALIAGAATLAMQRRPERRIGTLASMHGALAICTLLGGGPPPGPPALPPLDPGSGAWIAHAVLALTGAGMLARLMPVSDGTVQVAPALARRHPWYAALGLYAVLSLAGVPGTPGGRLWLEAALGLADAGRGWTLLALVGAWLMAFTVAMRQLREALGVPSRFAPPAAPVPWPVRASLAISGAGLLALGAAWLAGWGPRI